MKDEELNVILEQMAEEVPPMPADFHARWMNAVRAEAKDNAPAAEDTTQRKTVSLVRLTRILSVAAAFVFLVGGTLLWRSTKQSLSASVPAEKQEAAALPAAEEPVVMAAGMVDAEEEPAVMAAGMADAEEEPAAVYFAAEEAAKEAEESELSMKAAGTAVNSFAAASGQAAGAVMAEEAEEEASEADYAMEAVFDAEPAAPEPTAAPTAVPTAAPTAAPTEAPEPENAGFLQAAGAFFTDMGDFLLAALPYLLVLAVPAAAALVIRRKKARK